MQYIGPGMGSLEVTLWREPSEGGVEGACTYNVSTKGGGGVTGLLKIANQGEGVSKPC